MSSFPVSAFDLIQKQFMPDGRFPPTDAKAHHQLPMLGHRPHPGPIQGRRSIASDVAPDES
jgi:hypothetical protein